MKTYSSLLLSILGAAAFAAGCSSSSAAGDAGMMTGDAAVGTPTVLTLTETGWVDKTTNSLNIQGAWYAYGDSYGPTGAPPAIARPPAIPPAPAPSSPRPIRLVARFPQERNRPVHQGNRGRRADLQ